MLNKLLNKLGYFKAEELPFRATPINMSVIFSNKTEFMNLVDGFYLESVQKALESGDPLDLARAQQMVLMRKRIQMGVQEYAENEETKKTKKKKS